MLWGADEQKIAEPKLGKGSCRCQINWVEDMNVIAVAVPCCVLKLAME